MRRAVIRTILLLALAACNPQSGPEISEAEADKPYDLLFVGGRRWLLRCHPTL